MRPNRKEPGSAHFWFQSTSFLMHFLPLSAAWRPPTGVNKALSPVNSVSGQAKLNDTNEFKLA